MIKRSIVGIAFIAFSLLHSETVAARQAPPSSRWVTVSRPYLAKRGTTYVLAHSITSTMPKEPSWAVVEVDAADGSRLCEWIKKLEPKQAYQFECPLEGAAAGQKYASRVRVFTDETLSLSDRELFYEPTLNLTAQTLAEAAEPGAASTAATVVPDGVVEGAAPPIPSTFKPTWYRRVDRGFSMRAYENSGDLTVNAEELTFVDGKKVVRIPYARMQSVRWEPLPNDIANHWMVIRFTNDEDKPDGVAFRDGGRIGLRGETGIIYLAVRRATKK
jgi:hypothetical protein